MGLPIAVGAAEVVIVPTSCRATSKEPAIRRSAVNFEACVVAGVADYIQYAGEQIADDTSPVDAIACATPCPAFDDPLYGDPDLSSPCETPSQVQARQERLIQRWAGTTSGGGFGPLVIGHRGSMEFALENTWEAMESSMQLGADGNEIDIVWSMDGMPHLMHYGDNFTGTVIGEMTWN